MCEQIAPGRFSSPKNGLGPRLPLQQPTSSQLPFNVVLCRRLAVSLLSVGTEQCWRMASQVIAVLQVLYREVGLSLEVKLF